MDVSREILQDAAELANLGLSELDAEERFTSFNQAYLSMLGMQEADLLGRNWRVAVHPSHHAVEAEAIRVARDTGRATVEIRAARKDSKIIYQSLTVMRVTDAQGVLTGFRKVRYDVSSYRKDQETLLLAVESAPSGLLMLDSQGVIQSANLAIEELFGYTRTELIGNAVEMLLPLRFREKHLDQRRVFMTTKTRPGRDLSGLRKDGVEIPLQIHLNTIRTNEGDLILCNIIDIAKRVAFEQQLELAKQEAEAANRAKSDFLARMSHEIRTPMNLIMGMNALLLEGSLNAKQRQHVEISHRNVRRLLRLINGILDLSKVEAGMMTLEAVPFDLSELMHECAACIESSLERKGLELEISIDPGVWLYWIGDAERVQQVLLNLIGNSIKFTARGKIDVRVRSEQSGSRQGLRFEVRDTGCGIPPDKTSLIFEAFQQAEEAMNRPYEGTGLGLSIAKTLVEMMAGRIWVEETSKNGSKFVFTAFFPLARKEDVRNTNVSVEKAQAVEPGLRILVVEDNPENVVLLRAYLENLSLSLDFASNGNEAVEKRQKGNYDLVLMDIQMPVMDGYAATRKIRAWEESCRAPRVPVVALTAHALIGASGQSIDAGCDGHVTKPVRKNDLIEAIVKFAKCPPRRAETVSAAIAARQPEFIQNRWLDLKKMKDALAGGNFSAIQHIAHNAKGIGSGYGFPAISDAGSVLERAAKALDPAEVEKSIRQFEDSVEAASAALQPISAGT
jgi:PAS domain S-box-containing protein